MTAHILRAALPDGTELCATAALVARALDLPVEVLDEGGTVLVRAEADGSFAWVGPAPEGDDEPVDEGVPAGPGGYTPAEKGALCAETMWAEQLDEDGREQEAALLAATESPGEPADCERWRVSLHANAESGWELSLACGSVAEGDEALKQEYLDSFESRWAELVQAVLEAREDD